MKILVSSGQLSLLKNWKKLFDINENFDFPQLDLDFLRYYTCGTYQLKMSESYAKANLYENQNEFELQVPRSKTYGRKRSDPANFPRFPEAGFRNRFRAPVPIDFRQIPGIRTLLTYPFVVSRAVSVCDSGVSWRWPDPSSVPFRSGTDTEARIRPFPSGSSRCNNSTNTGQSRKTSGAKLTLGYLANQ